MYSIERYGYPLVFLNIFLESFGFPLPGETTLVVAAVLAGRGRLDITLVLVTVLVAAVAGDTIGYVIGRAGGRAAVLRFGRYIFLPEKRLEKVERMFSRYGRAIVLGARFVSGLRQLNGIVAGTLEMPLKTFVLYNASGAVLWVAAWGGLAYLLGRHALSIREAFESFEKVFLAALAVAVLVLIVRHFIARRRVR